MDNIKQAALSKSRSYIACLSEANKMLFNNIRTIFARTWIYCAVLAVVSAIYLSLYLHAMLFGYNTALRIGLVAFSLFMICAGMAYFARIMFLVNGRSMKWNIIRSSKLTLCYICFNAIIGLIFTGIAYATGSIVNLPRHPSQLYEALFEGVILFLLLFFIIRPIKIRKGMPHGFVFSFYLMGYGLFRFLIEYCRQPDSNIGYIISPEGSENIAVFESFLNISEGQIFCLLMIAAGAALLAFIMWRKPVDRKKAARTKGRAKGKRA